MPLQQNFQLAYHGESLLSRNSVSILPSNLAYFRYRQIIQGYSLCGGDIR
jgi:hypothetical protein